MLGMSLELSHENFTTKCLKPLLEHLNNVCVCVSFLGRQPVPGFGSSSRQSWSDPVLVGVVPAVDFSNTLEVVNPVTEPMFTFSSEGVG